MSLFLLSNQNPLRWAFDLNLNMVKLRFIDPNQILTNQEKSMLWFSSSIKNYAGSIEEIKTKLYLLPFNFFTLIKSFSLLLPSHNIASIITMFSFQGASSNLFKRLSEASDFSDVSINLF